MSSSASTGIASAFLRSAGSAITAATTACSSRSPQLELTTGGGREAPIPHPESLLVLYFESQEQIDALAARIAQAPVVPANPYWQRNARAFADPDGFQLLLTLG